MSGLLAAFFFSFFVTIIIIRSQKWHLHYSADFDLSGPQKFHMTAVPRIGGLAIFCGICAAILLRYQSSDQASQEVILLMCALPVFLIGIIEEISN